MGDDSKEAAGSGKLKGRNTTIIKFGSVQIDVRWCRVPWPPDACFFRWALGYLLCFAVAAC